MAYRAYCANLQQYAAHNIDVLRVTTMLLIHDIVEIYAGDLFAFSDKEALEAQAKKEVQAATRLFGLLPEKQYQHYKILWLEFESVQTQDAKFAKAMDSILPFLQNINNEGGSWRQHNVARLQE